MFLRRLSPSPRFSAAAGRVQHGLRLQEEGGGAAAREHGPGGAPIRVRLRYARRLARGRPVRGRTEEGGLQDGQHGAERRRPVRGPEALRGLPCGARVCALGHLRGLPRDHAARSAELEDVAALLFRACRIDQRLLVREDVPIGGEGEKYCN